MSEFTRINKDNPHLFDGKGRLIVNRNNAEMLYGHCVDMFEALKEIYSVCNKGTTLDLSQLVPKIKATLDKAEGK